MYKQDDTSRNFVLTYIGVSLNTWFKGGYLKYSNVYTAILHIGPAVQRVRFYFSFSNPSITKQLTYSLIELFDFRAKHLSTY